MVRTRKVSLSGIIEGDREQLFLSRLISIYRPRDNNISPYIESSNGGTPDKIMGDALKQIHRDRCFVWFDEDFEPAEPLSADLRSKLAMAWCISAEDLENFLVCPIRDLQRIYNVQNRKPTLIISQPVCVESIILKALEENLPFAAYDPVIRRKQIKGLKSKLMQLINATGLTEEEFYKQEVTLEILEAAKLGCPELALLISMLCI
jgi:hypothetical protein